MPKIPEKPSKSVMIRAKAEQKNSFLNNFKIINHSQQEQKIIYIWLHFIFHENVVEEGVKLFTFTFFHFSIHM